MGNHFHLVLERSPSNCTWVWARLSPTACATGELKCGADPFTGNKTFGAIRHYAVEKLRACKILAGGHNSANSSIALTPSEDNMKLHPNDDRSEKPFPLARLRAGALAFLFYAVFLISQASAQPPPFEWVRQGGGSGIDEANGIAVDSSGNVYVVGTFYSSATIAGVVLNAANFTFATFIAKYNALGEPVWARSLQASSSAHGYSVAVAPGDSIYVSLRFRGTLTFGSTQFQSSNDSSIAVAKYDSSGNPIWIRQIGGAGGSAYGRSVTTDQQGNLIVSGYFFQTINLGAATLTSAGGEDVFCAKYDPQGNFLWARKAGGLGFDFAEAVVADSAGNIIVTGAFSGSANFGGIPLTSSGARDIFLAKYDSDGAIQWARRAGSSLLSDPWRGETGRGIAVDQNDNIFVTGVFEDIATFGTVNLTSAGYEDSFLAKYNPDGTVLWARRAGGTGSDTGIAVAVDGSGNSYVTGSFEGVASFGTTNLTSLGLKDIFIAKYDPDGQLIWAKRAGLNFDEQGNAIAVDAMGNVFVAGYFFDTATFESTILSGGREEIFVAKLPAITPVAPSITSHPENRNAALGGAVTFHVAAGGTEPLFYQWQFNGGNITNATNSSHNISNVQRSHEGDYTVIVSNSAGTVTSAVARLTILLPPEITVHPESITIIAGETALFTVTAEGTAPLSYQWRFNGLPIPGETNATLIVTNAQPAYGGNYAVVVSNAQGAVTSAVATLAVRYSLTVSTAGGGTVARSPDSPGYPPNFSVTISATPAAGFAFLGWSGDASGSENPLMVMMSSNRTITAHFFSTALTIEVQGEGTISRNPEKPYYNVGEQVTLTASPGRWHLFTRWLDGSTANPRVVSIGTNNHYAALFAPTTALETLSFGGVSRTAPIGMPAIFVDGVFFPEGQASATGSATITILTTYPNGLILYTSDGSEPGFTSRLYFNSFIIRRSGTIRALALNAEFSEWIASDPVEVVVLPEQRLTAGTAGGGIVSLAPPGGTYLRNTPVNLSATPDDGWTFLGWLGHLFETTPSATILMDGDQCVSAVFGTGLQVTVVGEGTVEISPAAELYPYGSEITLMALPKPGHHFAFWGNAVVGSENPARLPVTNRTPRVSALFAPLEEGQVALTVQAFGRGRVVTIPAGTRFNHGQMVTLRAEAEPGQRFLHWSEEISSTNAIVTISMTESRLVRAHFSRDYHLGLANCGDGRYMDEFRFSFSGELGRAYDVFSSSGLHDWEWLRAVTNHLGIVQMRDTLQANRYYRVVEQP
jgi:hypothetical protein